MKEITIGILAHVDSGKTTLSEALLYISGKIRNLGRVDHKNTYLDTHFLERDRGITIFSKQANFVLGDTKINLIDTPGHADFSSEMERTLQVLDYAVLVISGTDGIQSHTETLCSLLKKYKIPTFVFVNKMDLSHRDNAELLNELKEKFSDNCNDFMNLEDNYENIAVCSEKLMDEYLNTSKISDNNITDGIANNNIVPCFFGSALKLEGVNEIIYALDKFTKEQVYGKKFGAKIYKITWDEKNTRLTHMKITGGSLKVKATVFGKDKSKNDWSEKVNQIRTYSGASYDSSSEVFAGSLCAVTGLTQTFAGQGLGFEEKQTKPYLEPALTYKVIIPANYDIGEVVKALKILEEEDPQLEIMWNEILGEMHLKLMGEIQLEVLTGIIKERFNFNLSFDSGSIIYKESIKSPVMGAGHFEPLKHYAEVHLKLEPLPTGSGIILDNKCSTDDLTENYQNLILSHITEKMHTGVLTNSALTDVRITLMNGRAHIKHTEGGDFRQATYRALRQALLKADGVLLEPVYDIKIELPSVNLGRALTDIRLMGGEYDAPLNKDDLAIIYGAVPVATSRNYQRELMSYTKGMGKISFALKGYMPCHNTVETVKKINYDPFSDEFNTGDSVFCSHGTGYTVKWNESDKNMHIKPEKKKEQRASGIRRTSSGAITDISEEDLMAIFERTYGPIKRNPLVALKEKPKVPEKKIKVKPIILGDEYLLVDGYNIIFDWEELIDIARDNLSLARDRLMDMMCNYAASKKCKLILVFDAYKVKGGVGNTEKYHNITVVYTKEAETADMYIEKVTHEKAKNNKVRVATSDGLQQMIILGHGALRVSARAFKLEVIEAEKDMRELLEQYTS